MNKLLVICGPTATGKTNLALHLAKVLAPGPDHRFRGLSGSAKAFGPVGELVSADSRQVYKKLNIGTGKDLPIDFKYQVSSIKYQGRIIGFYTNGETRIWGYDLVEPTQRFSVGQYLKIATQIIKDIRKRDKLPILVGGTGFYIKGVVDGIPTALIPQNKGLRKLFGGKKANELFEILTKSDPIKAASLNTSDKKNPRRLIRAIEIAERVKVRGKVREGVKLGDGDVLFIGLKAPIQSLYKKVEARVQKRINQGLEAEIKELLSFGVDWEHQSMNSLGYKQWKGYFEGAKTKEDVVRDWKKDERNYVKRQLTWFAREKRINWFNIVSNGWQKNVEKLVNKWYSTK